MRQRAVKAGVLSNPYQFVEAGEEFEHAERMNWAVPVEGSVAAPVADPVEPPARATRRRARSAPEVADDSAEDVI